MLDLDRTDDDQPIVDALLIYTVGEERGDQHDVEILWNETRHTAILFVDDIAQALVDFAEPRFMCRTGFPAPAPSAPVATHEWDEAPGKATFNRRLTAALPAPGTVPAMNKIKVLATTAILTAPFLLPHAALAMKASWT